MTMSWQFSNEIAGDVGLLRNGTVQAIAGALEGGTAVEAGNADAPPAADGTAEPSDADAPGAAVAMAVAAGCESGPRSCGKATSARADTAINGRMTSRIRERGSVGTRG
jgi:hypothetical protein